MDFHEFLREMFKVIVDDRNKTNKQKIVAETIVLGDFNINTIHADSQFEHFMKNYKFNRGLPVNIPSSAYHNTSQIDTIFVRGIGDNNILSGIYDTYFSDHKSIFIGIRQDQYQIGKPLVNPRTVLWPFSNVSN